MFDRLKNILTISGYVFIVCLVWLGVLIAIKTVCDALGIPFIFVWGGA